MDVIQAILFEPVGCLAEFPAGPFLEIAVRFLGKPEQKRQATESGGRAYWHMLNLLEGGAPLRGAEALEMQAVDGATLFDDVLPALAELHAMGVQLLVTSSLSDAAVAHFLEKTSGLRDFLAGVWTRDTAGGIKAKPLAAAIASLAIEPRHIMFLTDTAEGLSVAQGLGLNSVLMMNDPDDAMRLAMRHPSGGIVSLHELPDFVRLVAAQNA